MKIIRKGFEIEIVCPKCKALRYYGIKDIQLVGDMEGECEYYVKCQECGKEIKVI